MNAQCCASALRCCWLLAMLGLLPLALKDGQGRERALQQRSAAQR
jgi:hypothetical protein